MLHILASLVLKDLKLLFRNRQALIASLIFPFLLFFIFSFIFSNMMHKKPVVEPLAVGVVDHENSIISNTMILNITGNAYFSDFVRIIPLTPEKAEEDFNNNKLTGIVEIPSNFSRSLYNLENAPLTVTLNPNEPLKSTVLKNIMESYGKFTSSIEIGVYTLNIYVDKLNLSQKQKDIINENITLKLLSTAMNRDDFFNFKKYENIPSASSVEYFLIALMVVFLMYTGLTAGSYIISEVQSRCLRRIYTAPVKPILFIISKTISFFLFSLLQVLVFTVPLIIILGISLGSSVIYLILYMLLAILFTTSLSILIASFFRSQEPLLLFGNIGIFVSSTLGGSFIPLQLMPSFIQRAAMVTPNFWIIKGALYLFNSYPAAEVSPVIAGLVLATIIFLTVSARRINAIR